MYNLIENKIIVITGGGGTIGVRLAKKLLSYNPKVIRLLDQDDSALTLASDALDRDPRVRLFLGKIEDRDRLLLAFSGANYIFHLAAIKHVMISEYNPFDTINVNVVATENVIRAAIEKDVEKIIFASTDKAVNPTNTYGSTKLLGEKLMTVANLSKGSKRCIFSSVRFGNIMGSRGSVLPRFKQQLINNNKIFVTKKDMTRFVMLLDDAIELLIGSLLRAVGGEIFVLKMIPIKLESLANCVLKFYESQYPDANIEEIGLFEGEKDYEELLDWNLEGDRCVELEDMFIIIPKYKELAEKFSFWGKFVEKIDKRLISSYDAVPISDGKLYDLIVNNKLLT